MTANRQLLVSTAASILSISSSVVPDEVYTEDLLSRISNLAGRLVADLNSENLTATRQVEIVFELLDLEYRILVRQNKARETAKKSGKQKIKQPDWS